MDEEEDELAPVIMLKEASEGMILQSPSPVLPNTSADVVQVHIIRTTAAVATIPSIIVVFMVLSSAMVPLGTALALSLYIGLLCAVACHGSLSAVAKRLERKLVFTRSSLGHLQVELRKEPKNRAPVSTSAFSKNTVPNIGFGGAHPSFEKVFADAQNMLKRNVGVQSEDEDDSFHDAVDAGSTATSPRLAPMADVDPPPIYSKEDPTSKASDLSSPSSLKSSIVRYGMLGFLAVPVLVHTTASVVTTASIEGGYVIAAAREGIRRIRGFFQKLGDFIHDNWDPVIMPFLKSVIASVAATISKIWEGALQVYPWIKKNAELCLSSLLLLGEYAATNMIALYRTSIPLMQRMHSGLVRAMVLSMEAYEKIGVLIHDGVNDALKLLQRLGVTGVLAKIPRAISAGIQASVSIFARSFTIALALLQSNLEKLYIFLENKNFFKHMATFVTTSLRLSVKYTTALAVLSSNCIVAFLVYTKSMASPLIHAFWESVQPLFVLLEETWMSIRKGFAFDVIFRISQELQQYLLWALREIQTNILPAIYKSWQQWRGQPSKKKTS
ncbi:hypothetical protein HDU97_000399 [Phlyctochytrium planicorne]|nr:hypothetical protein HDU97_000399 [Phlyctochytrium planicorne]